GQLGVNLLGVGVSRQAHPVGELALTVAQRLALGPLRALGLLLYLAGDAQLAAAQLDIDVLASPAGQLGTHQASAIGVVGFHGGYPRLWASLARRPEELGHAVPHLREVAERVPELAGPAAAPSHHRPLPTRCRHIHPSITSSLRGPLSPRPRAAGRS